jgi:hypothetical protein
MRGQTGVDIPAHKLEAAQLTPADIFKALAAGDASAWDYAKKNYIDPVQLQVYVKEILDKKKKTKKSFSLVVDSDAIYTPGETFAKAEMVVKSRVETIPTPGMVIDIKKSRIEKIERILLARRK